MNQLRDGVRAAYLGDGVYIQFQPGRMILTTEDGVSVTNRIVLEPEVWAQLLRVVRQYDDKEWPFVAADMR
jgi:hypothetical protein